MLVQRTCMHTVDIEVLKRKQEFVMLTVVQNIQLSLPYKLCEQLLLIYAHIILL